MKKLILFISLMMTTSAYADEFVCTLITRVGGKMIDSVSSKNSLFDGMPAMSEIGKDTTYASAAIKQVANRLLLEIHEDIHNRPLKVTIVEGSIQDGISYFRSESNGTSVRVECNKL